MQSKNETEKQKEDALNYFFRLQVMSTIAVSIGMIGLCIAILAESSILAIVCAVILAISIPSMVAAKTGEEDISDYYAGRPSFFVRVSDIDKDLSSNQVSETAMTSSMV